MRCVHTTQRHPKYTEVEQFCGNDFVVVVSGAAVAAGGGAAVVINHKLLLLFLNITITTKNISIKEKQRNCQTARTLNRFEMFVEVDTFDCFQRDQLTEGISNFISFFSDLGTAHTKRVDGRWSL